MNTAVKHLPALGVTEPIDFLLADIAIRIQLSRTEYNKAVQRYGTMQEWIERQGSPLRGKVNLLYPQGSMAIGSTIARVSDRDEYDIDLMVELDIPKDSSPKLVLNVLHDAIRGEKGSRYFDKTIRHTRCVCVTFEDGMHMDLTPSAIIPSSTPRTSHIFHSKPEDPHVRDCHVLANPWGFAEWFKAETSQDADFARFFEQQSLDYDTRKNFARAPTEQVPRQEPVYRKSRALVALQLIKRWRNVLFARSTRSQLRRPPSVLLSKLIAVNANRTQRLSEEVEYQAACILARLEQENACGTFIHERNPLCRDDVLTDRWPASRDDQNLMIDDLRDFVQKIHYLRIGNPDIEQMRKILEELFGERPTRKVLEDYVQRSSPGSNRVVPATGRVIGLGTGIMAPASAKKAPPHTFYGD